MADKDSKDDKPKIPPVVRLKNAGKKSSDAKTQAAPGDTARIFLSSSGDAPSRVKPSDRNGSNTSHMGRGPTGESPADTSRIDLGQAKPDETARIHLQDTKQADSAEVDRDRIDLSKADPSREDMEEQTSATLDLVGLQAKQTVIERTNAETSRVDLAETRAEVSDTEAIGPEDLSEEETHELMKRSTVPIKVTLDDDSPSAETSLVDPRQSAKRETAKLDDAFATPVHSVENPGSARINLEQIADIDDVFKRTAAGSTVASLAGAAAAIHSAGKPASTPKSDTARIDVAPDGKAVTARIELPAEDHPQTATGRKTIKLKKRAEAAERPASGSPLRPAGTSEDRPDNEDLGVWPSVVGMLTLIAMGVLVYVLAAQSVAPDLPFPGKL